jgi:hypothetical protein
MSNATTTRLRRYAYVALAILSSISTAILVCCEVAFDRTVDRLLPGGGRTRAARSGEGHSMRRNPERYSHALRT